MNIPLNRLFRKLMPAFLKLVRWFFTGIFEVDALTNHVFIKKVKPRRINAVQIYPEMQFPYLLPDFLKQSAIGKSSGFISHEEKVMWISSLIKCHHPFFNHQIIQEPRNLQNHKEMLFSPPS